MNTQGRYLPGVLFLILLAAAAILLSRAGAFGFTLFVVAPAALGGLVSWIVRPTTSGGAALLGAASAAGGALFLLMLGQEGLACVGMALPLVTPLGAFGAWMVYLAGTERAPRSAALLLLVPPATLGWDIKAPPAQFEVHSQIVVAATPEQVWRHVVSFADLPEPAEWYFRAGIAYPKRARIVGSGVGATRYCEFSTGPFVEPIEVWDAPRLLRFRVTENPAPLEERGLWGKVEAKHLHGYLISRQGQFKLTGLADGRTLLEGTTWYQHGLWPAEYWRWWSDAIIHRIHQRVLNHIQLLAERENTGSRLKSAR